MKCAAVVVSALSLAVSAMAQSEIIYNNTSAPLNSVYSSNLEFGDEINFAGQNREVSRIQFEYNANAGLVPDANKVGTFKIYANDGANGAPNTLIYSSGTFGLQPGSHTINIDTSTLRFLVPNTVTWTLSFSGLSGGDSAGALLYNPPTVGSSPDSFWQKDALGAWGRTVLSPLPANFGARITAVPEPGTVTLMALGAIALGGYALRRRSSKA